MKILMMSLIILGILPGVLWSQQNSAADESVKALTREELIKTIRAAPEETKGKPGLYFIRLSPNSEHPVLGIRRTVPAKSELHTNFSDVWQIVSGSAELTTGGTITDAVDIGGGEIRGSGISGGTSRIVKSGDFVYIRAGTAHWISRVMGRDFIYVVTKFPPPAK